MQFSRAGAHPAFLLLYPQRNGSIDINRGMDMMSKLFICSASSHKMPDKCHSNVMQL